MVYYTYRAVGFRRGIGGRIRIADRRVGRVRGYGGYDGGLGCGRRIGYRATGGYRDSGRRRAGGDCVGSVSVLCIRRTASGERNERQQHERASQRVVHF